MPPFSLTLNAIVDLAKAKTVITRYFDSRLGGGLGFNEFVILYHLSQAAEGKLRRIDLAEKIGLTASGVTRLLAPMEKIGLIRREEHSRDARVSYVTLAPSGKRIFEEQIEKAELLAEEALPALGKKQAADLSRLLAALRLPSF